MCQLLETIKCKDGQLFNMEFHQARFDDAQNRYFAAGHQIALSEIIEVPAFAKTGLFRCRVTYSTKIDKIEFLPHRYREIKSLKIVCGNAIDYSFKFADRRKLDMLFEKRGNCDDIIIVKNGNITDSYVANLIFFDGQTWRTPDTPLLPGTQRAKLLYEGKISECKITPDDLTKYKKVGLINALNNFDEMQCVDIANILE